MKTCITSLIALLCVVGCREKAATISSTNRPERELIGVNIKTSWTSGTRRLALTADSAHSSFVESYSTTKMGGDRLSPSISVAFVGDVSLENAFDHEGLVSGSLIAVRVSIFDHETMTTILSDVNYKLYKGEKLTVYQNDEHELTITASPHDFDEEKEVTVSRLRPSLKYLAHERHIKTKT